MKIAVITGASSGLGRELAVSAAGNFPGIDVFWLIARNEGRLRETAKLIEPEKAEIIPLDLSKVSSLGLLEEKLKNEKPEIGLLINDAGVCFMDNLGEGSLSEQLQMVDLNVRALMALFGQAMEREYAALMENNVRVRHLGSKERLGRSLATRLDQIIADTANNTGLTVNVAINYGGRAEISEAVRAIIAAGTPPEMVSEVLISEHLGTAGQPDPDLIIRTAGEMRLSNFLLWQAAYAEYYSTPLTWPEFGREAFYEALLAFGQRKRRFGKLNQ